MIGDVDLDDPSGILGLDERTLRRPGWTCYRLLLLTAGQSWALPLPDLVLALATPRILDLACSVPRPTPDEDDPGFYRRQQATDAILGRIAARLLVANYQLTADQAKALVAGAIDRDNFNASVFDVLMHKPMWWPKLSKDLHEGPLSVN